MTGTLQILLPARVAKGAGLLLPETEEKLGPDLVGGDVKMLWDSERPDEVDLARRQFSAALTKGMAAFKVTRKGEKGERITQFDPEAEAIILAPALQGG